ncbi:MAG: hypothetical protein JKP98_05310 [Rhodobacteraceae bacterium]|nr:hypothetical protein [Paracoccaceae bacterium]
MGAAQTVHAADGLRDGRISRKWREKGAKVGVVGRFWQGDISQQGVGFFVVLAFPCMSIGIES